jgi:deoxyribonuclease-4
VTEPEVVGALLDEVDRTVGIERLRALHVNDAAAPLGSNRDRHANLLEGLMGNELGSFLGDPRVQALPALLETPGPDGHGPDAHEVAKLRGLHEAVRSSARGVPHDSR